MVIRSGDPLWSTIVTPGITKWFTVADVAGTPKRWTLSACSIVTKVIVIHDFADSPLWLDLWSNIDTPAFLWSEPLRYRYSTDNSKNIIEFNGQPLRTDRLDISLRITAPYTGGTVKDPTGGTISIGVVYG
jgi:hypothetical protein